LYVKYVNEFLNTDGEMQKNCSGKAQPTTALAGLQANEQRLNGFFCRVCKDNYRHLIVPCRPSFVLEAGQA
jgi:hypothetical protein